MPRALHTGGWIVPFVLLAVLLGPVPATQESRAAGSAFTAYAATATVDGTILPMAGMPDSAAQDVGHIHLNLRFAVADAAHFRLDIAQTEPGFDADTQTFGADGSVIRAYFAGEREALKSGLHSGPAHPAFNTSGGQALEVALLREDRAALTPTAATMKKKQ